MSSADLSQFMKKMKREKVVKRRNHSQLDVYRLSRPETKKKRMTGRTFSMKKPKRYHDEKSRNRDLVDHLNSMFDTEKS